MSEQNDLTKLSAEDSELYDYKQYSMKFMHGLNFLHYYTLLKHRSQISPSPR